MKVFSVLTNKVSFLLMANIWQRPHFMKPQYVFSLGLFSFVLCYFLRGDAFQHSSLQHCEKGTNTLPRTDFQCHSLTFSSLSMCPNVSRETFLLIVTGCWIQRGEGINHSPNICKSIPFGVKIETIKYTTNQMIFWTVKQLFNQNSNLIVQYRSIKLRAIKLFMKKKLINFPISPKIIFKQQHDCNIRKKWTRKSLCVAFGTFNSFLYVRYSFFCFTPRAIGRFCV